MWKGEREKDKLGKRRGRNGEGEEGRREFNVNGKKGEGRKMKEDAQDEIHVRGEKLCQQGC